MSNVIDHLRRLLGSGTAIVPVVREVERPILPFQHEICALRRKVLSARAEELRLKAISQGAQIEPRTPLEIFVAQVARGRAGRISAGLGPMIGRGRRLLQNGKIFGLSHDGMPRKRGRKSADELATNVVELKVRRDPPPPPELTPRQAEVWTQTVASMPAGWFGPETWPLLAQWCAHVVEAGRIRGMIAKCLPDDLDHYETLMRLLDQQSKALKSLGSALRLSPQARIDPRAAGRRYADNQAARRPWQLGGDDA